MSERPSRLVSRPETKVKNRTATKEEWRAVLKLVVVLLGVAGFVCWLCDADHVGYWLTFTAVVFGILQPWEND
jgi:hypothetical protein